MNQTNTSKLIAIAGGITSLLAVATTGRATIVEYGLYDTGVDNSGASLAAGAVDSHYALDNGSPIVVAGNAFPIPPWLDYGAVNGSSRWTSVDSGGGNGALPVSDHLYETSFTLTGLTTAMLSGKWSADNASDVYLNGTKIASQAFQDGSGYSFTHYNSFATVNQSLFNFSGINYLAFVVHNGDLTLPEGQTGGWFGLRAEDLNITAVPEASTMFAGALLLLPFGAGTIRFLRRNRAL